jgi:hypothetical protein
MPNYNGVWSLSTHYQYRTDWPTFVPPRGVFGGGAAGPQNIMQYIEIDTTGNTTDFGDLTGTAGSNAGVSNKTRGVVKGGNGTNTMEFITIATTGDATDFGDLTVARSQLGGTSDGHGGLA